MFDSFLTSRLDAALGWARKFSIFQYPFVTACCGMEYMATACSHYDVDRFGAGLPRFSPRQADVLFVVGTISHKLAPALKRIHDQMAEPKWVVAFGVCTCTGGFYDNIEHEGDEKAVSNYGSNYARLAKIKGQVDPGNLFRLNSNIKPA